jgi:tagatose-6-phosphate ketose/aldose isomerase
MSDTVLTVPDRTATHQEIFQQPSLWPLSLALIQGTELSGSAMSSAAVITGAGTSAYAAAAIAHSWHNARAVPTTDLLLDSSSLSDETALLVSIARSGDSPESIGVLEKVQRRFPQVRHLAITCNAAGKLARATGVQAIVLDPRTNDKSLAMTSSFSNLVLAGIAIHHAQRLAPVLHQICSRVESQLPEFEQRAEFIAGKRPSRAVVLASPPLFPIAREAALKILEMTAGTCIPIAETFLGLRHGPMSFVEPQSLVLCFLSSDPVSWLYEMDLIAELRAKRLGYLVAIAPHGVDGSLFDEVIPASAGELPDVLRAPFEIVFAQLLAYHLSLRAGLNPDNPSPNGVITRVVGGVRIHGA